MKEINAWVLWFQALVRKIDEGGEAYLAERANRVDWHRDDPALLRFGDENIDPFSFFYFLAQCNGLKNRGQVYKSVDESFGIDRQDLLSATSLNHGFIIPTPTFTTTVLFHWDGKGNPVLLWELFRRAIKNNSDVNINAEDFEKVLGIHGVGVAKLTQTLFLINPDYFIPVDKGLFDFHSALNLPSLSEAKKKIEQQKGWEYYAEILNKFGAAFPQCRPYEINTVLYMMGRWKKEKIDIGKKFFQVSTNIVNDRDDYWEEFQNEKWVQTGAPDPNTAWDATEIENPYPIRDASNGDIILVRYGQTNGRAIGVVYKNDYADKGLSAESAIHVLWLNQSPARLARHTEQTGFSILHDGSATYQAFADTDSYRPTFKLIQHVSGKETAEKSQYQVEDTAVGKETINDDNKMKHPLNQILYGPPGTGKTWNTVNHALAIIEGKSVAELENENRNTVKQRFDELKESGQIEMVTFHQNFAYEDFIEGIKPVLGDNSGDVDYEIVDGVFKAISNRANENLTKSSQETEELDLGALLQDFAQYISEKIDQGETIKLHPETNSPTLLAGVKLSKSGKIQFRLLMGHAQQDYLVSANVILRGDYMKFLDGEIKKYQDIKPTYGSKSLCHGHAPYLFPLMQQIKTYQKNEWQPVEQAPETKQNYVLIIDEINRGNIAKIFGELITLIEDTKRIGADDETTVTLPYSGNNDDADGSFGVPNNLYIIGTMNTADRSIALLDTALRRRFDFIEMMPQAKHDDIETDVDGVNCQELLTMMNKRITALLDREHQIGHSYFIGIDSMEKLARVFQNKIIPLLQEYFYDDWAKIRLVLNKNKFVTTTKIEGNLFGDTELVDIDRLIYELIDADSDQWTRPENYTQIYASKQTRTDDNDGE